MTFFGKKNSLETPPKAVFALLLLFCRQYRVAKTALAVYGPSYLLAFHVHLSSCNKVGIVHNCIVLCIRALLQVPASWLGALDLHGGARICARYIYAIDCARAFAICISTDVMLALPGKMNHFTTYFYMKYKRA